MWYDCDTPQSLCGSGPRLTARRNYGALKLRLGCTLCVTCGAPLRYARYAVAVALGTWVRDCGALRCCGCGCDNRCAVPVEQLRLRQKLDVRNGARLWDAGSVAAVALEAGAQLMGVQ